MSFREASAAVVVFVLVVAFRFLSLTGFPDDHYVHLAGAQQMLYGEWPTHGFVDLGAPLSYAMSAAAQALFGRGMLTEALLMAAMFGVAAIVTLRAGVALTGSVLLALAAVAVQVLMLPRSYSDTKMLVYSLAALAIVGYATRPGTGRLVLLAMLAAASFLVRHDHGLYIGVAAFVAVLLSPIVSELPADGRPEGRPLHLSAGTAAVFALLVLVLVLPYLLYLESADGILAHVRRGTAFAQLEMPRQRLSLTGLRPEVAWLLHSMWVVPVAALVVVGVDAARRTSGARSTVRVIVPLAVLALLADAGMIRDSLDARLADAVVTPALLLAWLTRQTWRPLSAVAAWPLRAVSSVVLIVTIGSAAIMGRTMEQLDRAGVFARSPDLGRELIARMAELRRPFEGRQTPSAAAGQMRPFFDYASRCLAPDDRVLVPGFLPEIAVLAGRAFAGGQVWFMPGALATRYDHSLVMARLDRERVPVAVLRRPTYDELAREFPELDAYVTRRFDQVAEWSLGDSDRVQLLAARQLVRGRDAETGWPCFR
jgi:hypothetical protein